MPKELLHFASAVADPQAEGQAVPHAPAAAATDLYVMPATQGELRFWSLDQLNPGNPALNMPLMWQCTGELDLSVLRAAVAACVQRHEVLRTTFGMVEGRLSQIVHAEMEIPIPVVDLSMLSGELQRAKADEETRAHAAYRMDLKSGPLLLLKLLKYNDQRHMLLVTMHHIICDGISNGILQRDLVAFYEAMLWGSEPRLPELPIQFADYAIWHEEWRAGDEPAASMEFWRRTLGNDFQPIKLAHDPDARESLPPERREITGDVETLLVPHDLTARAHAFCKRQNVTLNILFFSVFCALLNRITGQRDLTIGSPCANRTEDTENLIGLFTNIQVLRVNLEAEDTFLALMRKVQAWTLGAYENQSLPFEDLIHDPFFSETGQSFEMPVFFLYQKSFMLMTKTRTPAGGTLEINPLRSESPGAIFEMMFAIVDREEEGPRLQLEYNPQSFKVSTVQRYLRLYINLLESAIDRPAGRVDEMELLSPAERVRLMEQAALTAVDFGEFIPVHAAFLARAKADPHRVAAVCAGEAWTYGELAGYASSLAARMMEEGLRPGELVAVSVSRSLEMLGSVMAVLMAGGAYMPLDPRHPNERLQSILDNSGATIVLTNGAMELETSAKVVSVDGSAAKGETAIQAFPAAADSLAYVIYTSGSTGVPKGVAIEHGALMNLLLSMEREPGLCASDVLVAVTTLAFDIATLELLLPLIAGARLVIATDEQVQDPAQLLTLLSESGATVMQATPGAWLNLIDQGWDKTLPLKVLCGGEAMSRSLADKLMERSENVWNVYGPTETTIWSSANRVVPGKTAPRVGPPIANTQFYVLDDHRQPVPSGVGGELYIGGSGLARGYWQRPELTAAAFFPNPFGPGRIYKTGDCAVAFQDGSIQLQGRADFQVKVRGFRIELGEIEAALLKHPAVREAVVVQHVAEDAESGVAIKRLVAYVAAGEHAEGARANELIEGLMAELNATLPEYMTPNAVHALVEMPRTPNGKVDRKALPDVFAQAGDSGIRHAEDEAQSFLEPSDVVERQLTEIWQTTLGIARISVRASFFSLGVGSLAALRLITKMNKLYGTDLGLASLISASSIAAIAELIRNRFSPNTESSLVPIQPAGTKPPLFIVHGVGGNVVNFYGLSMRMGPDQPVYGIQSQALVANQPALVHLKDMARHYLSEIRKVQPHGPYHLLGYSFGGTVVLEMAHQLREAGEAVAMVGMLDSKSKDYEEEFAASLPVHDKINRRLTRFTGNTRNLSWRDRIKYVAEKISTRTIRFTAMLAARLKFAQVPAFMRSAYDINYVAVQNYELRPYDGRLILFRASEQDNASGSRDLGWGPIFREGVEIHDLPGDHERIFLDPNIDELASSLRASLNRA